MSTVIKRVLQEVTPYLVEHSFRKKKRLFYKVKEALAFCIEFENPGGLIYVNYYVIPLYVPHTGRCFTYGNRATLNIDCTGSAITSAEVNLAVDQLRDTLRKVIFPLFEDVSTPRAFVGYVSTPNRSAFFCTDIDIARLKFFTYAFLGENKRCLLAEKEYCCVLKNAVFLNPDIRNKRFQEIDKVDAVLNEGCNALAQWFDKTARDTLAKTSLD